MTAHIDDYQRCAEHIVSQVGEKIIIGVPLGLGKPIGVLNALFAMALQDESIHLTIVTGLTLARPHCSNLLEKRFVEPIVERLLQDYEDPLYEKYRVQQSLPRNINVIEFFLAPGKFLSNQYVQKNYISSGYTTVVRDVVNLGINVLAQQVSVSIERDNKYSLSCNTDLFHGIQQALKLAESAGNKMAIVGEVNANLPYMYGEMAEVTERDFSIIVDTKRYRALFALPKEALSAQDHMIGLYTSLLIRDNGCLQVGIGKLSNALASALIFRHKNNIEYRHFIESLQMSGDTDVFTKGLYASTEMLSDEYLQLYQAGIIKKKVYDHPGLQALLNSECISDAVNIQMIVVLLERNIIDRVLSQSQFEFLQTFGIFNSQVKLLNNQITFDVGYVHPNDLQVLLDAPVELQRCLGDFLKNGKIIHAGFFLGSSDLYTWLRALPRRELQQIDMCAIARTNSLLWWPELLQQQRKHARFVNTSLMVTLVGGVISDGLKDYQELSGVGGQYDFVSMGNQLPDARSIINVRSTRVTKHGVESNIIWDCSNNTIPRYLRDYVVTEYGIADCRSKTDEEVIKAMLNIADSRFQAMLLSKAKLAGKVSADYVIPASCRNNYPEVIAKLIAPYQASGFFQPYPFGSDMTEDEQVLARALVALKSASVLKLVYMFVLSLFILRGKRRYARYLQRMGLMRVGGLREYLYRQLLVYSLMATGAV